MLEGEERMSEKYATFLQGNLMKFSSKQKINKLTLSAFCCFSLSERGRWKLLARYNREFRLEVKWPTGEWEFNFFLFFLFSFLSWSRQKKFWREKMSASCYSSYLGEFDLKLLSWEKIAGIFWVCCPPSETNEPELEREKIFTSLFIISQKSVLEIDRQNPFILLLSLFSKV